MRSGASKSIISSIFELTNPLDVQKWQLSCRDLDRPRSTSADLRQGPQKQSKIKDLGLLTYIFGKSATRRLSWCNSQFFSPSGRRDMSETMIPLTGRLLAEVGDCSVLENVQHSVRILELTPFECLATVSKQRSWGSPHPDGMLISNRKVPSFSQSRSVGRNTVSLISRRPEGLRSWELHHENRRVTLFPKI